MSRTQHGYARGDLVVVVDCADLERAARFWAGALGYLSEGGADGALYRSLLPADGHGIEVLLQLTSDAKHEQPGRGARLDMARARRPGRKRILRPPAAC